VKESYKQFILVAALAILALNRLRPKEAEDYAAATTTATACAHCVALGESDAVQAGQSTQLTWRTENANDVTLRGHRQSGC